MRQVISLLAAIILFSNCNNNGGGGGKWSAGDEAKWMNDCTPGLVGSMSEKIAGNYCKCILEKLEKKYANYDQMNARGTSEEGKAMGLECKGEITGGKKEEENNGGILGGMNGWSNEDRERYMNECVPSAVNTGTDEQTARTYCDCTLKKLEKKYKNYAEAQRNMTQEDISAVQQQCREGQNP